MVLWMSEAMPFGVTALLVLVLLGTTPWARLSPPSSRLPVHSPLPPRVPTRSVTFAEETALGRVHQTSHGKPTTTTIPNLQDLAYSYDAAGNLTAITDRGWTGSRTFTYDALNRLSSADDLNGNMLTNAERVMNEGAEEKTIRSEGGSGRGADREPEGRPY